MKTKVEVTYTYNLQYDHKEGLKAAINDLENDFSYSCGSSEGYDYEKTNKKGKVVIMKKRRSNI